MVKYTNYCDSFIMLDVLFENMEKCVIILQNFVSPQRASTFQIF